MNFLDQIREKFAGQSFTIQNHSDEDRYCLMFMSGHVTATVMQRRDSTVAGAGSCRCNLPIGGANHPAEDAAQWVKGLWDSRKPSDLHPMEGVPTFREEIIAAYEKQSRKAEKA